MQKADIKDFWLCPDFWLHPISLFFAKYFVQDFSFDVMTKFDFCNNVAVIYIFAKSL